jgi:predicted DNA-binding transcriptional regulator YafY
MNSRSRQDELLRLLRRRGTTLVEELQEQLEVSRRTVLRDIAALRAQGYIIHSSPGAGGGLLLDPSSVLVTPKLTSSEVFALLISFAVLKQTHDIPFANLADAGLRKIEQSLPRDRVAEMRRILRSFYIGHSRPGIPLPTVQEINKSILGTFETCFLDTLRMRFRYTDRHGKKTSRHAEPHAMLVLSPAWYMIGFDSDKQAFRHFRMDRISSATATEDAFLRRSFTVEEGECPFTTTFI